MKINKALIIRFSSFGDIVQCSSVVELIRQNSPEASIDWVTRSEFANLVKLNLGIRNVWPLEKKSKNNGIAELFRLGCLLRKENYDHVYDAHNNLRSKLLMLIIRTRIFNCPHWLTRPKDRFKRILLFYFRINCFPKPFIGIDSYRTPLKKWGIHSSVVKSDEIKITKTLVTWHFDSREVKKLDKKYFANKTIVLVPFAAWEMKRWPLESWKKLIFLMPENQFVILGGKDDFLYGEELRVVDSQRVSNFAGKLSLVESCALIKESEIVISADTGLLHVADVLGVKGLSLMGPTAFGFTSGKQILTLEIDLPCRPCSKDGRGRCSQAVYQRCMVEITPEHVAQEAYRLLAFN